MPEFECQTYWHELPQRIAPWKDDDERRAVIAISKQIPGFITPLRTRYFAPSSRRHLLARARLSLREPTRLIRGIISDFNMTMLGALNVLIQDLGRDPISVDEAAATVEGVNARINESTQKSQGQTEHLFVESPMLQVLRELIEGRDLAVTRIERKDLNAQGRRIHAADLQPNKLGLIIVDREQPLMALAVAEPHNPRLREKRQHLHLFVPLKFPQPWWRRARQVARIDTNLCVCAYVHHKDVRAANNNAETATTVTGTSETEESDGEKSAVLSSSKQARESSAVSSKTKRSSIIRGRPSSNASTCLSDRSSDAASSANVSDVDEADELPKKLRRLETLRSIKFRNFVFEPLDDPLRNVVPTSVKKFRTRKGVVHHWSQRLIERWRRNQLYNHQLTQDDD